MQRADLWPRPSFSPSGAEVKFDLYCFSAQPAPLGEGSPAAEPWCPYPEIPEYLDIGVYERGTAGQLFDKILGLPLGRATLAQPELFYRERDRWAHCCCIELSLPDAPDLGYLQCAWATARWLANLGAAAVYDDASRRWFMANELAAWPTPLPFDVGRELQIVFETDRAPEGHLMHTRGMRKFGRPDLLHLVEAGHGVRWQVEQLSGVMRSLAHGMALGAQLRAGSRVQLGEAELRVEEYRPGVNCPDFPLENGGLVLVRP